MSRCQTAARLPDEMSHHHQQHMIVPRPSWYGKSMCATTQLVSSISSSMPVTDGVLLITSLQLCFSSLHLSADFIKTHSPVDSSSHPRPPPHSPSPSGGERVSFCALASPSTASLLLTRGVSQIPIAGLLLGLEGREEGRIGV